MKINLTNYSNNDSLLDELYYSIKRYETLKALWHAKIDYLRRDNRFFAFARFSAWTYTQSGSFATIV